MYLEVLVNKFNGLNQIAAGPAVIETAHVVLDGTMLQAPERVCFPPSQADDVQALVSLGYLATGIVLVLTLLFIS